jgi:RHS repeat-associated protein
MSASHRKGRPSRSIVSISTVVAVALIATVADAQVAFAYRRKAPAVQKEPSVDGVVAGVEPAPGDATAVAATKPTRDTAWPGPASAAVTAPHGRSARAGTLPVRVRSAGKHDVKLAVDLLPQDTVTRRGLAGVPLRVRRADGVATAARVSVKVDYSSFANAIGGDWASRLRLVSLPSGRPVPSRNDFAHRTLTATVDATSSETTSTMAVTASAGGGAGDYSATSLSPSSAWQVNAQTGDFSWSYPFRVPPGINGPTPALQLGYSSGSVDGRVASTNAQPSWIGEGHSMEEGYVERKYVSCADDQTGGNNTVKTGDLCWRTDNANVVLSGHSGELVKDAATGVWHLESDDASKMEKLTGGFNGAQNSEYWKLTTSDGTQYYFGLGKRYAADTIATNSTWTVPVFGNQPGEPCYTTTFATAFCTQAWRWNLDYVVDPHNNTMTYTYVAENNNYGRNNNTAVSTYQRGGYLSKIEYGERKGTEATTAAPAQVDFTVSERCVTVTSPTFNCETTAMTSTNASNWPDAPFDQICTSTTTCTGRTSPSFFTRKRLTKLVSKYLVGATPTAVDTWDFAHTFPDPGDGTSKALWLASIQHTGNVGTAIVLPKVTFAGVQMQNRVDGIDIAPPLVKWRVSSITTETGATVSVNYMPQECVAGTNVPASPETDNKRCFPVFYTADGQTTPTMNWFHKYVVANIVDDDRTGSSQDKLTTYTYLDTPAWHFDDNELSQPKYRTYSDYRGYGKVRITLGTTGQQSITENLYLRGMDEDPLPGGLLRDVKVTDSEGGIIDDHPRLSGTLRETRSFDAGVEVTGAIYDPYVSAPTAINGTAKAYVTGLAKTRSRVVLAAGGVRRTESSATYDQYGMVDTAEDLGELATTADDLCSRTTYARNTTLWIMDAVSRTETVSAKCSTTPSRPAQVVSDTRSYFDGSATWGAAPTQGLITKTEVLDTWTTQANYKQKNRFTYDTHGRTLDSFDALDRKTSFAYTPATGGPVTQMTETNPLLHIFTTTLHPAWGVPTVQVDTNTKRTDLSYDALGRLTQVWLPTRAKASFPTSPNMRFTYLVRNNGPVAVTTEELRNDGTYTASYELYDGLLRPRQSQVPASGGGRVLHDTVYDSRGMVLDRNGPYFNVSAPTTSLLVAADSDIPTQVRTTYDGANRPTVSAFRVNGIEKWRTTTTYGGDRFNVDPPAGETATTRIMDARGRMVALRDYTGGAPTGAYDETTYQYDPDGQVKAVHDAAGNSWTYTYDLRGRLVSSSDPDRGTATTTYNDLDQVATVTDARTQTLAYVYDVLDRPTELHQTSTTGPMLATWTYDAVVGAKGKPSSSSRFVGTDEYKNEITAYDAAYRPTTNKVTIPASEGALAGTYTTTLTYNVDGGVKTIAQPAATGLPNESLTINYDSLGKPNTLAGLGSYVSGTTYSPYGETLQLALGNTIGHTSWETFAYEEGTRRLERSMVDRVNVAVSDADVHYTYDPAGNVTKIADAPVNGPEQDTQCFTYDHLRRLTEAWTATNDCATAPSLAVLGGPAPYWRGWTYDTTGNRRTEADHTASGTTNRVYGYPAAGGTRPHALSSVVTTRPDNSTSTDSFGYDNAGNLTSRTVGGVADTLAWDAEGRLGSVSGPAGATSFVYDANGDRLIRRDPQAVTLYLDNTELRLDRVANTVSSTRYYRHNGMTIAMRQGLDVETVASDHHGTASVSLDNATSAVTKRRFDPFGVARDTSAVAWMGDKSFVGGTADPTTKLVHLGARDYDPVRGRFVSVDPLMDPGDPQQMNGYAYSNNNPVSFSDPDGLMVDSDGGSGGSSGGSSAGATQTPQPKPYRPTNRAFETVHDMERPLTAEDYARIQLDVANGRKAAAKSKVKSVIGTILKIAADELGITAAVNCFTQGDAGACGEMVFNIVMSFVGGIAGKLLKKYGCPWKWKKAAGLVSKIWKLANEALDTFKTLRFLAREADEAEEGLKVALKYKDEWTMAQRAAADVKVSRLNEIAQRGEAVVTKAERSSGSAAAKLRKNGIDVPKGSHGDHIHELQLGGSDTLDNLAPLDGSVNSSIGSQIHNQIKDSPLGTLVSSFSIT